MDPDCGSAMGYEYRYRFYTDDDIIRRYSCFNIREDVKILFEFRTNFRVKGEGDSGCGEIIDSERFEMGAQSCDYYFLYNLMWMRLYWDYWFSNQEIIALTREASAFARAQQQGGVIPMAVELDICAVPVDDESMADVADRAMRSEDLFPLWLMYDRNAFVNVEKPPYRDLLPFLRWGGCDLGTERVFLPEYYRRCFICRRSPRVGEQYTILEKYCGHMFHYRCLVLSLIAQPSCPICSHTILPIKPETLASYQNSEFSLFF